VPDTKPSAFPSLTLPSAATDQYIVIPSGGTASKITLAGLQQSLGAGYRNGSTATVSAGYASDTYLAGSAVTVPAGAWKVGTIYQCGFDMVKTAAGSAAFTITIRIGTLGTTGDTSVYTIPWGAGTAAIDTGWFEVYIAFRTVGAGATIAAVGTCAHHLAATGLVSTGASGNGIIAQGVGGSFSSTTATILGLSVNGGASFSGTNTTVQSLVLL